MEKTDPFSFPVSRISFAIPFRHCRLTGDHSRIKFECETLSENIRRSDRASSKRIKAFEATTYDSGLALRLARPKRRALPGIYTTILLFCHIFRQRSSLASCPSKPLTLLSIFVTRIGGGFARVIRVPVSFLLAPGFLRNSIWYTGWDVKELLVPFRNGFIFLLCSWTWFCRLLNLLIEICFNFFLEAVDFIKYHKL